MKESTTPATPKVFNLTEELRTPCDQDESFQTAADCAALTSVNATNYYICPSVTSNYGNTVQLISDVSCPGEDRLLQCELNGGKVGHNIPDATVTTYNPMFIKTAYYSRVRIVYGGN